MYDNLNDFVQLLNARYSCRAFKKDEVPKETLKNIVSAAQKVPSWCNSQPWGLAICSPFRTSYLSERLIKVAQKGLQEPEIEFPKSYTGVYKERRSECGWKLYDAVGIKRGDRQGSLEQMMENFRFFGAPQVAIVTTPKELGAYGMLDCGSFISAFMLAARSLGIDSIAQASIAGVSSEVRKVIDIDLEQNIVCAISIGFADENHPANSFRTGRVNPEKVISWID